MQSLRSRVSASEWCEHKAMLCRSLLGPHLQRLAGAFVPACTLMPLASGDSCTQAETHRQLSLSSATTHRGDNFPRLVSTATSAATTRSWPRWLPCFLSSCAYHVSESSNILLCSIDDSAGCNFSPAADSTMGGLQG